MTRSMLSVQLLVVSALASSLAGCQCRETPTETAEVTVQLEPKEAIVIAGETASFKATVGGTTDGTVIFTVDEPNGGVISKEGLYTAASTLGVFHVRATSATHRDVFALSTVTVVKSGTGISVKISPASANVATSASQQFTAVVTGAESTDVYWKVLEGVPGGTITSTGQYTAPASTGVFHVVATSVLDATASAMATVTVAAAPAVSVSINPANLTLGALQTQQFSATVLNANDPAVTWNVLEPNGGTVTPGGFYTAPVSPGVYHLEVHSRAQPDKLATATITVQPIIVAVTPQTALVEIGSSQQFNATVTGAANTAVTWSVQEGPSCGSVSASGLYTPPSTVGTCHIIATSVVGGITAAATATVINPVTVVIQPLTVTLSMNQTQQFTATVMGSTNQAVSWSVLEGALGGTITSAGLYTAPTVTANTVLHVVATPQANPAKAAQATVTVVPGIGVQVTPQLVTLTPGAGQKFTATVTGTSNIAVTWSVQEGTAGGSINASGQYVAPTTSGTYHVVASAQADTSKKGFATVVVLGAPVTVTGIVTYAGAKTGTVYVILANDDGSPGIVGTSTQLTNGQAPFTLKGIQQRGNFSVRAFVDTMASGMYHQAVDPFGSVAVTVGNSGLTGVVVPAADSTWNKWLSTAQPTVDRVVPGDESVLVAYSPAWDSNGNDECKDYRLYWSDTPNVSGTNNIGSLLLTANAPRVAVVRGLTNGQKLYFTMTCPDALLLGGYAPEVGPITVGIASGGYTVNGTVNSPALTGSIVPPLYVVALSATGASALARIGSPTTSQAYALSGLPAGQYSLYAFRDVGGDGKLTPTDPNTFTDPVRIAVSGNQNAPTINLPGSNAVASVFTGHLNDSGAHSYSLRFRVRPNLKRAVKAQLVSGPKVSVPYDLPLDETGGARHEVVLPLANTTPASGDTYTIAVTYSDGTTENLSASVSALLPAPSIVSPVTIGNATPAVEWLPLSPVPAGAYTMKVRLYDWPYLALGEAATLLGWADDVPTSTTLLLYSDLHPTQSTLSAKLLPYWLTLRATDGYGNWSQSVVSFTVQ